ncbi:hypothetical protein N9792_05745 [Planktomarina temperata]|nr:hypothetical protein [Planktomarina temperata]
MKKLLTVFFVSTASLATADNFVDAMVSGDAQIAECNVTIKDNYFDFTFSGLCKGSAYSSDQAIVVLQTDGVQSENALEYFFIFPSIALVNDGIPASWNGTPFAPNASNPIGLGAYEGNCYLSDVAKVCVEPMKAGDDDK